jgi:hypothetical protein
MEIIITKNHRFARWVLGNYSKIHLFIGSKMK